MNMIRKVIFFPLYVLVLLVDRIKDYYKKEAVVTFDYISRQDEADELTKEIDSFHIRICAKKRCIFTGSIPIEEAKTILQALEDAKHGLELVISHGIGEENILIPRWAVRQVFDQLSKAR